MKDHLLNKNLISRWMEGRLSQAEKKQLEESGELDALKVIVDDIATWSLERFDVEEGLKKIKAEQARLTKKKRVLFRTWYAVAASVLLLCMVYVGWNYWFNSITTVSTQMAEKQNIVLPDASIVDMDAFSSLTYDERNWPKERTLTLNGQAFFQIEKGGDFTIHTSKGTISVIGTKFNVEDQGNRFVVKCFEGKVEVSVDGFTEILEAGEAAKLENDSFVRFDHKDINPDWLNGFSNYDQTPLPVVVEDLHKYYKVGISLPARYADRSYSGKVPHNDLEIALKAIFIPLEIRYMLDNEGIVSFDP